jgi:tetraprenyl-beta-curcumene synthase
VAAFADRLLLARAAGALTIANLRFWSTVAPRVRTHLARWERRAHAIQDPGLQALALSKLREEHFNAEVAATLATLCGTRYRPTVVEALVAYEILYDYLDGLTELPSAEPLRDGRQLYRALTDAIAVDSPTTTAGYYFLYHPNTDGGYLDELVGVVRAALTALPSSQVMISVARRATERCAEAQVRAHAVPHLGPGQLERWARREADGLIPPLGWQGFLAGAASSVLTIHALIAASGDGDTTAEGAAALDAVYLSTAVLSTLLDGLVDYEDDQREERSSYLSNYPDAKVLTADLLSATRSAVESARLLPTGPHHTMTLVGVVAYYLSAPGGRSDYARAVTGPLAKELNPLLTPTLAIMRAWRAAKRVGAHADAQPSS